MKKKSFSRQERKNEVRLAFARWIQRAGMPVQRTSYQIARELGITASSHLRSILDEMVEDEILVARREDRSGRWLTTLYELTPGTYELPEPRQIRINPGRKNKDQMEMVF